MDYEQRLRAVGRLLDRAGLHEVCLMEVPGGVAISGVAPCASRGNLLTVAPTSLHLDDEQIARTSAALAAPARPRRWFGRA